MAERRFIYGLEQSRAKYPMYFDRGPDDLVRERIITNLRALRASVVNHRRSLRCLACPRKSLEGQVDRSYAGR